MSTAHEQAERIVADQAAALARFQAGDRNVGESYDLATGANVPPKVETVEAVVERLNATAARADAFRQTPRGRFLTCIDELEQVGLDAEAVKLRTLYNSSITLLNGPEADQAAVGEALLVLNGIGTSTAREGIDALAELLVAAPLAKAA